MKATKQKKERYLAVMEHELAISAFAEAMKNADTLFVEDHGYLPLPMTMNMKTAANRFIEACARLNKLNEKA